jgi:WXG100 family type VII secretion target
MADTSGTSVLAEVNSTGGDVNDTVNQVNSYAQSNSDSGGGGGDPLQSLIEKGLDFLIDLIEPVKDALNMVTGDPAALTSASSTYQNLGKEIGQLGQQLQGEIKQGTANWKGDASDAAQQSCQQFLDGVQGTATLAGYISQVCQASAGMMQTAHDVIVGIIASFVEQMLITWAVDAVATFFTFGLSNAAAMAASVSEAGIACARAGEEVSKVAQLIEKVGSMIEKISQLIEKISGILEKLGSTVEKFAGEGSKLGKTLESLSQKGGTLGKLADNAKGTISDVSEHLGTAAEDVGSGGKHLGDLGDALKSGDSGAAKEAMGNVISDGKKVYGDYNDIKDDVSNPLGSKDKEGGDGESGSAEGSHEGGENSGSSEGNKDDSGFKWGDAAKDAIKTSVQQNVTQPLEDAAKTDGKQILSDTWNNGSPDVQAGVNDLDNLRTFGTLDAPQAPDQSSDQIDQELSAGNPSGQGN